MAHTTTCNCPGGLGRLHVAATGTCDARPPKGGTLSDLRAYDRARTADYMTRTGSTSDGPMHHSATLTGGTIPAHTPGAYPSLSCCGGAVALVPADTLPRWYIVQGTRHTLRPDGYTAVRDVPTFYLSASMLGIMSAEGAVRIAHDILGTTEETATLWAYAAEDVGRLHWQR